MSQRAMSAALAGWPMDSESGCAAATLAAAAPARSATQAGDLLLARIDLFLELPGGGRHDRSLPFLRRLEILREILLGVVDDIAWQVVDAVHQLHAVAVEDHRAGSCCPSP